MKHILAILIYQIAGFHLISAQIGLDNPSFEGEPIDAMVPTGWHACEIGTTPDILPGPWGVVQDPYEGETYMGLITRQDGTWESVGQRLKEPLMPKECYSFSIYLARSNTYSGYNLPIRLRIWGSQSPCKDRGNEIELLAETSLVEHLDWKRYEFEFFPDKHVHYIILEAFYPLGVGIYYNGNILIDNCSQITLCKRASIYRP